MKNTERRHFIKTAAALGLALGAGGSLSSFTPKTPAAKGRRIGMIGLDTSHCLDFVTALNAAGADPNYEGFRVVAAYPYGSRDIESSYSRIPGYREDVKRQGVEIVGSVSEVIDRSDVIMLETNDGKLHLEQVLPVLKAGKRVFIDKPLAASYKDVMAIYEASEKYRTPVFSASSLRYVANIESIKSGALVGKVLGADTFAPCDLEPSHPDFYWYGIHGVEILFAIMGKGCQSVTRIHTESTDIAVGAWEDGRVGVVRGARTGTHSYGGTVFGEKGNAQVSEYNGYAPLLLKIISFFNTGVPPVDPEETKEIYAFMEAADESKRQNGRPVPVFPPNRN